MRLTPTFLFGVKEHILDARFDCPLLVMKTRFRWPLNVVAKSNETGVVPGRAVLYRTKHTQVFLRDFPSLTRANGS